eukprot:3341825-Pleurochrysis_carterae.AAC.2
MYGPKVQWEHEGGRSRSRGRLGKKGSSAGRLVDMDAEERVISGCGARALAAGACGACGAPVRRRLVPAEILLRDRVHARLTHRGARAHTFVTWRSKKDRRHRKERASVRDVGHAPFEGGAVR